MATISGLTAERMREIEAASIVDGTIDASGHLILTKHDGQLIDAGNALVAVPQDAVVSYLPVGSVTELTPPSSYPDGISLFWMAGDQNAADWPTFAGSWGTLLTINWTADYSPNDTNQIWSRVANSGDPEQWIRTGNGTGWTVWRKLATTKYVDDQFGLLDNTRILPTGVKTPTDPITAYPRGLSMMSMSGATGPVWGSSPSTQFGTIITAYDSDFRAFQLMQVDDGYLHFRRWRGDLGGWRPWTKVLAEQRLSSANFTQTTALASYPWGTSYLYLTGTESSVGGWDFTGKFGLVTTFRYSDDFIVQTWQKQQGGTSGETELWQRTANASSGWSRWRTIANDNVAWNQATPTWQQSGGTVLAIGNGTLAMRYAIRNPKTVNARMEMTRGSTTNTGTATYAWLFPASCPASRTYQFTGTGAVYLASGSTHPCFVYGTTPNTFVLVYPSNNVRVGAGTAGHPTGGAWASGDTIVADFTYEHA